MENVLIVLNIQEPKAMVKYVKLTNILLQKLKSINFMVLEGKLNSENKLDGIGRKIKLTPKHHFFRPMYYQSPIENSYRNSHKMQDILQIMKCLKIV